MSFAGGGDNSVEVNINGSSMGLVDALRLASDQMIATGDQMAALADAASALGASTAASADGFAAAGAGASEYGAQLEYLQTQLAEVRARMEQMAATMGGGSAGGGGGGFSGGGGTISLFSRLGDGVEMAAGKMLGFVEQAGAMLAGLVSFSILNDVAQEVQGFTDSLITLNEQTEKNVFSWQYLFGGKGQAQSLADWTKSFSMQIPFTRQDLIGSVSTLGSKLSTQQVEQFMPYIADYASTLGASGYGGQGVSLQQASKAILELMMGRSMMFKMAFNVDPAELTKYGLDAKVNSMGGVHINDPSTLITAMENYAKHRGIAGAAKDISHETFWGSWSSFIDRIQNFELDTGKGLFGSLKKGLTDLSSWIDTHADQISRFSDLIGSTLANAFKTAAGWVGDFMSGLGQSGLFAPGGFFSFLAPQHGATSYAQSHPNAPKASAHGVTHPRNQVAAHIQHANDVINKADNQTQNSKYADPSFWERLGKFVGDASKAFGDAWKEMTQFVTGLPGVGGIFKSIGDNLQLIGDAISQGGAGDGLKTIFKVLMATTLIGLSPLIGLVALVVAIIANFHRLGDLAGWLGEHLGGLFGWIGKHVGDLLGKIGEFFGGLLAKVGKFKDQVLGKMGELKDKLVAWAGDLKNKALTWGQDMLDQFITGIKNKMGDLGTALGGVGQAIKNVLGHSAPTEGPLVGDDQWMPDMMALYARGIREGIPGVVSAVSGVAGSIAGAMRPTGGYGPLAAGGLPGGGTTIIINGTSTLEAMKLIDYAISRQGHGVNVQARTSSGYGYYTFGTLGGR